MYWIIELAVYTVLLFLSVAAFSALLLILGKVIVMIGSIGKNNGLVAKSDKKPYALSIQFWTFSAMMFPALGTVQVINSTTPDIVTDIVAHAICTIVAIAFAVYFNFARNRHKAC